MVDRSVVMLVITRGYETIHNPMKPPFSHGFPMVLPQKYVQPRGAIEAAVLSELDARSLCSLEGAGL